MLVVSVDRANELQEAETRELVAECLFLCADLLEEMGETFSSGELRDEAEFQRAEAQDLRVPPVPKKWLSGEGGRTDP